MKQRNLKKILFTYSYIRKKSSLYKNLKKINIQWVNKKKSKWKRYSTKKKLIIIYAFYLIKKKKLK